MRYWTSDLHFGHTNIIAFADRSFRTIEGMNRQLIYNWNETVSSKDEVWILGDFALGDISKTLPLVARLNGRKLLVPGNHDRCWQGNSKAKADLWASAYLNAGFDEILPGQLQDQIGGHTVQICHFPYWEPPRGLTDKHSGFRPEDRGLPLLHGHVHSQWRYRPPRMLNVGTDVWNYRPVSDTDLLSLYPEMWDSR